MISMCLSQFWRVTEKAGQTGETLTNGALLANERGCGHWKGRCIITMRAGQPSVPGHSSIQKHQTAIWQSLVISYLLLLCHTETESLMRIKFACETVNWHTIQTEGWQASFSHGCIVGMGETKNTAGMDGSDTKCGASGNMLTSILQSTNNCHFKIFSPLCLFDYEAQEI